jgi:hypothetical protein
VLAAAVAAWSASSRGEPAEAFFQTLGKVRVDGRGSVWVTAGRFGAWLLGFADAERAIEKLVGVGCAGVLGDKQQDAPLGGVEHRQKPPRAVKV